MKRNLLLAPLLLLAACASNQKVDRSPSSESRWVGKFDPIVKESENLNMWIIPNYPQEVPKGKLQLETRYIGDQFMRGRPVTYDYSGVSSAGGSTTMVINTKDLRNLGEYRHITGGGPHIWIAKDMDKEIRPWAHRGEDLVLQVYAAIPTVDLKDGSGNTAHSGFTSDQAPVTQASFGFYIQNVDTEKYFAYIVPFYESRGHYQERATNNDTQVDFASSPLEDSSLLITKSPYSEAMQSSPFPEKRFFRVHITRENLLRAVREVGMPDDLSRYRVVMTGVLFELPSYVIDGDNTSILELSWFSAYIFKRHGR